MVNQNSVFYGQTVPRSVFRSAAAIPHCQRNLEAFPEVGMPQVTGRAAEITQINERLANYSRWPMLCTSLWSMRTRLRSENSREGGEEFSVCISTDESRRAKAFEMFRKTEPITIDKGKVNTMLNVIRQLVKDEKGAAAAEYALFLALITVVLAATVGPLGTAIQGVVTAATGAIS